MRRRDRSLSRLPLADLGELQAATDAGGAFSLNPPQPLLIHGASLLRGKFRTPFSATKASIGALAVAAASTDTRVLRLFQKRHRDEAALRPPGQEELGAAELQMIEDSPARQLWALLTWQHFAKR
jgi:hypothetical protein